MKMVSSGFSPRIVVAWLAVSSFAVAHCANVVGADFDNKEPTGTPAGSRHGTHPVGTGSNDGFPAGAGGLMSMGGTNTGKGGSPSTSAGAGSSSGEWGGFAGSGAIGGSSAAGSAGSTVDTLCAGKQDGDTCRPAADTVCQNDGKCMQGKCLAPIDKDPNTVCEQAQRDNPCQTDWYCQNGQCQSKTNKPDGDTYDSNKWHRCCGGSAADLTRPDNCGGCGIKCKGPQACEPLTGDHDGGTHYYCTGCDSNNRDSYNGCWSGCCAEKPELYANHGKHVCAASDCKGNCPSTICPNTMTCVSGVSYFVSNWCDWR